MNDDFFIGWQGKVPEQTGRFLKRLTIGTLVVALVVALALPALQETVAEEARFDFGNLQEFRGVLVKEPVPMLVGEDGVVYLLVNPFKFGFDPEAAAAHHLHQVTLTGTRIYRGEHEMIEVKPGTVAAASWVTPDGHPLGVSRELGEVTLRGEIVDSKCYLGVMNPGNLKPHRACAINCIEGGVPPVLLVRDQAGQASYFLLVGDGGESLNSRILDLVAEPVGVTGRLKRLGKQRILYTSREGIVRE